MWSQKTKGVHRAVFSYFHMIKQMRNCHIMYMSENTNPPALCTAGLKRWERDLPEPIALLSLSPAKTIRHPFIFSLKPSPNQSKFSLSETKKHSPGNGNSFLREWKTIPQGMKIHSPDPEFIPQEEKSFPRPNYSFPRPKNSFPRRILIPWLRH